MKIRTKITGMAMLLVLLAAASIFGVALYQKKILERNVGTEVEQFVRSETNRVAQDVYIMCRAMEESLDQMLAHGLKVAMEVGVRRGHLDFNGPAFFTWQAVNQFSGESHRVVLPKVKYNGHWLGHNTDSTVPTPLVDEVFELQGMTCTVFQRINEAGDMLRVATTVPRLDGSRAIGTYIPRYNPDGSPNPVIETLLRGEVFSGRAYVVDDWYQTGYQPLWDASGSRVVGALYVGKKHESVASLRRVIQDIVIGKSGYVAIIGAQGEQRGKYLISKGGERDGEDVFKGDDQSLKSFRSVIDKAPSLGSDQPDKVIPTLYYKYPWQNPGETQPRRKSASIAYFEPWDWVIMVTAYNDDYAQIQQRMASPLAHMIEWIAWVAAVVIVLSLLIGYYVTRGIVRPLDEAVAVFDRIGQGQLDQQLNVAGQDEIGQLSRSFNQMVINLKEVTASRDELNHEIIERKLTETKLKRYKDHLEELVVERTTELNRANLRLQQDIMLREEAEGQLRESQQMLQLVLDYIPQYVFWKDRDSVYLGCNRNFARAAGVETPQELVGKTDYDLPWTKEEVDFYRECDRRVMESDTPELHITESQRQADGKQAWLDTNKIPLHDGEGRVVGILGTYEDITERQLAENALRKSEKRLMAANMELEAFTYTVSHDFRTPLTVILGYADLLQKSLRDRLNEQEFDSLSLIYDSGIRMVELMEDLLGLAKVGQIEQPAEPLNTGEVVSDVVCGLAEIVTEAGAAVAIGALPTLRVPRTLLVQVFQNLIGNALRYGCKPGDVIEVGGERKGEKVRLYVRDYGPGIPKEERSRIFEVFYRGTTGKNEKGTGIGLATVQKVARLFDGRAWVEETSGGGSTFWVEMRDVATAAENEEDNSQGN
jgi:PAS domain S-box-containing protein